MILTSEGSFWKKTVLIFLVNMQTTIPSELLIAKIAIVDFCYSADSFGLLEYSNWRGTIYLLEFIDYNYIHQN